MIVPIAPPPIYTEPDRPQFHFTARDGWLNDPNGLVFYQNEYHLFFQHNPCGTQWGNMTWGHAVSKDLVHWTQVANAIEPDALGTIFSGSAVVDEQNTSGFGSAGHPPLVCIYTAAGGANDASKGQPFSQCLAYSPDGRHFTKFVGNPALPHQAGENRDPKVIWYRPQGKWVMALYLDEDRFGLFSSPDLKHWGKLSEIAIPGTSECPDFFEIPIAGRRTRKWVFWTAPGVYLVGRFDGTTFTPETKPQWATWGDRRYSAYASQTYFNDPHGRRIQIAWFQGADFPGAAWNQQMGVPTEVTLHETSVGPRLFFNPVRELAKLRHHPLSGGLGGVYHSQSGAFDVDLEVRPGTGGKLTIETGGLIASYDGARAELDVLGNQVPLHLQNGILQLRLLIDRTSIEIFGQGGLVYIPQFCPIGKRANTELTIRGEGGYEATKCQVFELGSAWNPPN